MSFEGFITGAFLIIFVAKMLTKFYLDYRNLGHIQKNRSRVPSKFASRVSLEDHQKAADYARAKSQFNRFALCMDGFILMFWTLGGGLEFINQFALSFSHRPIPHALICFAIFSAASTLISLPQSWFSQFIIEEKFGFNKSTTKIFLVDFFKQTLISIVIGLPMLYGLFYIIHKLGNYWWAYGWGFITFFQLFMVWAFPTFIAPLFNKFDALEEGALKKDIEKFLEKVDFPFAGLFIMDASKRSSHGNAYFTGFGKNKRIVFYDTLVESLDNEEIIAVLAHEIGHYKKKHIAKMLMKSLFFTLAGLYIMSLCFNWPLFFTEHGVQTPNMGMGFLLFLIVSPIYTFCLVPLNSYLSRKNEYEADKFAHENSNSKKLSSALVKMYKDNASTLTPDPLYSSFYHSHPPALERVSHLESLPEPTLAQ